MMDSKKGKSRSQALLGNAIMAQAELGQDKVLQITYWIN
jgi:hypothetical protein